MEENLLNKKTMVSSLQRVTKISEVTGKYDIQDVLILNLLDKCKEYAECMYDKGESSYKKTIADLNREILRLNHSSDHLCILKDTYNNNAIYKSTNNI